MFFHSTLSNSLPEFSPDGSWLAYVSNESGANQIYVRPYPGPGGKWQVSTDGGLVPRWSKAGHELFYLNGDKMMVVPYTAKGDSFEPGTPRVLLQGQFAGRGVLRLYDVAPDGKHFVMFQAANEKPGAAPQPVLVLHWFDQVRRLVQAGGRPSGASP